MQAVCDGGTRVAFALWLSGYYNGKRNNTIIEPETIKEREGKVQLYCTQHLETTVMDAVKNVLGFDK
jgi:hypothetical protein